MRVIGYLKVSVAGFDRRFGERELVVLEGPEVRGDGVWLKWCANYRSEGLPPLSLSRAKRPPPSKAIGSVA